MNKQQFFGLIVSEAISHYNNPVVSDQTEVGQHFCVVNSRGNLEYMSLSQEVMNSIYKKFLGVEEEVEYDFRPFIIHKAGIAPVICVQSTGEQYGVNDYIFCGLDTLEILVDPKDPSKYLILNEGDEVENTAGIVVQMLERQCVFAYEDGQLAVGF